MIEVRIYRAGRPVDGPVGVDEARDALVGQEAFVWLDAVDPSTEEVATLERTLGLHPLTVEDAIHRGQRPKTELFESYAFVALRPFVRAGDRMDWDFREVHALVASRSLATIRFGPDPFPVEPARHRWETHPDLLDAEGGAFALWALADEVVDGYLEAVESMEDAADLLEDEVFGPDQIDGGQDLQQRIFRHKRDATRLRRVALPLRPAMDLLQEEPRLVGPTMLPYFRDLTEHVLRVADLTDNIRDLLTSLLEVRVAQVANHMNEIMKKLSAWAGIILVPTLIAGIYGMNFRHMPELGWGGGYLFALGLMLAAAGGLYALFRYRDWL
jgi:magnesium transporter